MKHWAALLAVIALSSAVFINTCTAACWNYSWFGKSTCDYRCHCDDNNNCDRETGQCADRCALGWFGPACQYRSILFFSDAGGPDLNWLTDGDSRSCNSGNTQTVTVELDKEHPLTWIRVVGNNSALIHRLELSYRTKSGASEDKACSDSQTAKVDDFTLDISCPTSEPVSHVTLSGPGVGVLCSLDVSKGRNVAIAQETRQSSTFSTWYDRNAVDGNVGKVNGNEEDLSSTCTHTDSRYDDGWWSVTFETFVQVNSFVIYNRRNPSRRGCCEYRLIGFNLKAYNTSSVTRSSEVFDYTDPGPEYQDIYTITPQDRIDGPVKKVRIVKNDKSNILTLCEVIVFGDSACDPGKFGRECERECNCADDEEACFVSTGGCPSGCAPGYTGEDCWTSCTHGKYGFGCLQTCSQHCVDPGNCDSVSGACVGGCQIGYEGPLCKEKCLMSTYGQDCKMNCSSTCLNNDCHHVTGKCKACVPGYRGDFCNQDCSTGKFGAGCSQNCSIYCLDQLCHHVTGKCDNCTTGRRGDYCDETIVQRQVKGGSDDSAVIGAVIGVTLIVMVTITIVLFLRWRSRSTQEDDNEAQEMKTKVEPSPSPTKPSLPTRPVATAEASMKIVDDSPENVYTNVLPDNTAVAVGDMRTYLHNHASDTFIQDQFESIPMVNSYSQTHGTSPSNKSKNRYKNIIPYDHSRVLLSTGPGTDKHDDYINASYIKGYNKEQQAFIAAQGPNATILDDFVRMIWEKRVDRVVMLTNLVEARKSKCTMYWPQDQEDTFGDITMKLVNTKVFAEYTIRQLRLFKSGETPRDVTQFHFTAWPDKLVPDNPWGLVDFHQRVLASPGSGPLLVHCSAGVGRTGTFIALCHLLQEAEATGKMDFLSTLWRLRQDRMQMIQTADQYVFLHWAALVGHLIAGTNIQVKDIPDKIKDLESGGYKKEFHALTTVCPDDAAESSDAQDDTDDVYQNSRTAMNKQKNRLKNILPKDAYRPELTCEIKTMGKYINAVLVPTLTKNNQDILTQLPLPSTVTDFWRLVTQYHVGLVVAFEADSRLTDETIGEFLPEKEGEPIVGALFEIQAIVKEETQLWKELYVTVFKKRKSLLGQSAQQHHLTCLLCKNSTLDPETVLEYLKKVKLCRPGDQSRTIYMCRNGADHCGLMCVQSILLDRLDVDQCLTVPVVVGAMKAIRPQVIPTVTHYQCLYGVLKLVHNGSNVYGNIGSISATIKESKDESTDSITSSNHSESKEEKPKSKRGESLKESNRSSRKKAEPKPSPVLSPKPDQAESTAGNKDKADGSGGGTGDSSFDESTRVEYANM